MTSIEVEPVTSTDDDGRESPGLSAFAGLLWDVGIPLVGYYALHLLGATDWVALLVATLAAGLRLIWVAVRARQVTWFAAIMLAVFGLGLALAFVGGDPRFLLLKDSFGTGLVGLVFLASLMWGKPLTLSAFQTWQPKEAAEMEQAFREIPPVRHSFRLSSAVWGVGLLAEAAVRVPLIYLLPIDVMVGVSTAMMVATIVCLAAWNLWYGSRVTARRAREWVEAQEDRRS